MSNERADIAERWVEVCRLLNAHGAEYLVIGRVGMGLHGFDYATRDLDILVPRDRDNMTRVLDALSELPYGIARELDPATETRKMMTIGDAFDEEGLAHVERAFAERNAAVQAEVASLADPSVSARLTERATCCKTSRTCSGSGCRPRTCRPRATASTSRSATRRDTMPGST